MQCLYCGLCNYKTNKYLAVVLLIVNLKKKKACGNISARPVINLIPGSEIGVVFLPLAYCGENAQ